MTGPVYQTLPLYLDLGTTGTYIYARRIDVARRMAEVVVESQVHNASAQEQRVVLSAVVVDASGVVRATITGQPILVASGVV